MFSVVKGTRLSPEGQALPTVTGVQGLRVKLLLWSHSYL